MFMLPDEVLEVLDALQPLRLDGFDPIVEVKGSNSIDRTEVIKSEELLALLKEGSRVRLGDNKDVLIDGREISMHDRSNAGSKNLRMMDCVNIVDRIISSNVRGILEIGAGYGANIELYAYAGVQTFVLIEMSEEARSRLATECKRVRTIYHKTEFLISDSVDSMFEYGYYITGESNLFSPDFEGEYNEPIGDDNDVYWARKVLGNKISMVMFPRSVHFFSLEGVCKILSTVNEWFIKGRSHKVELYFSGFVDSGLAMNPDIYRIIEVDDGRNRVIVNPSGSTYIEPNYTNRDFDKLVSFFNEVPHSSGSKIDGCGLLHIVKCGSHNCDCSDKLESHMTLDVVRKFVKVKKYLKTPNTPHSSN